MEKLNTIYQSDNINIEYGEIDNIEKKVIIKLLSPNNRYHFIITINLSKYPICDLNCTNDIRFASGSWKNNFWLGKSLDNTIGFLNGNSSLNLLGASEQNYAEICKCFIIFSKYNFQVFSLFNSPQDFEDDYSLIDKAFEIAEPKLKEIIKEFIEYSYSEEKQNNTARILKKEE